MRVGSGMVVAVLAVSVWAGAQSGAESMFKSKCAKCHGADGSGKGGASKMHVADLRSKPVQQMTDDELFESIAKGKKHREYPHAYLYQGMSSEQIRALVGYIRVLGK